MLPQGFTNSVAEFQNCTMFILQDEIPLHVGVLIDDIGIKGPPTRYEDEEGNSKQFPRMMAYGVSFGNMPLLSTESYTI